MSGKITDLDSGVAETSLVTTDVWYGGHSPFGTGDDYFASLDTLITFTGTTLGVPDGGSQDPSANAQTIADGDQLIFLDVSAAPGSEAASVTTLNFYNNYLSPKINTAADARIAAATIDDLSGVTTSGWVQGYTLVFDVSGNLVPGAVDNTTTFLDGLTGKAASKHLAVNSSNNGYEFVTAPDTSSVDDAAAVAVAAASGLNADYIRLSDHLTLDGATDQYTAFKALVEASHTKTKVFIFDGLCAVDLSAGVITLGGPQIWVTDKEDFSQGLVVDGVVITGNLVSIVTTKYFELSRGFYVDGSGVTATNRTALPAGTTLFGIGARATFSGKWVGVLNENSTTTATGTGLSFAKSTVDAAYDLLTFRDFHAEDWWRVWFSDNTDDGLRRNYYVDRGYIKNIGIAPFVFNMPGAKNNSAQNVGVYVSRLIFEDWGMDYDCTVGVGASSCRHVAFRDFYFTGYGKVCVSLEEMNFALIDNVRGSIDHSRYTATATNAAFHIKANNVSSGSYVSNDNIKIANVDIEQTGNVSSNTSSYGILLSGNSGSSVDAMTAGFIRNFHLVGFLIGIREDGYSDYYSPIVVEKGTIAAGSATGAGVYGVWANQINTDWTDIVVAGCQVGCRATESSEVNGWTFRNCSDTVIGPDVLSVTVTNCKFVYTGQTVPGSSSLVIKFLPVSRAATISSIWSKFVVTARSKGSSAFATASYEFAYTNAGGITGSWPPGSDPASDAAYNIGDSDQLITWRSGVGATILTLGPADEASSRGIHFADTDESSPATDGCLALKVEKGTAGDVTNTIITIQQSGGAAIIDQADRINDLPS